MNCRLCGCELDPNDDYCPGCMANVETLRNFAKSIAKDILMLESQGYWEEAEKRRKQLKDFGDI